MRPHQSELQSQGSTVKVNSKEKNATLRRTGWQEWISRAVRVQGKRSRPRTPADVLHAIDVRPDGTPHLHTEGVRYPAGWIRYRLGLWLGGTGAPLPPHSAHLARRAELAHAARARLRPPEQAELAAAASADPDPRRAHRSRSRSPVSIDARSASPGRMMASRHSYLSRRVPKCRSSPAATSSAANASVR